jgi:hypothetical protein
MRISCYKMPILLNEYCSCVDRTHASYVGSPRFKIWPRERSCWLRFTLAFFNPCNKCWDTTHIMAQQFPFIASWVHYPLLSLRSSGKWHLIVLLAVANISGIACSSDMLVSTDKTTWYHKPEGQDHNKMLGKHHISYQCSWIIWHYVVWVTNSIIKWITNRIK